MPGSSAGARVAAALAGAVVVSMCATGCSAAHSNDGASIGGESGMLTPKPVSPSASAVTSAQPVPSDDSGGLLEPAPADTTFLLTADQVQRMLAKDGASAEWVAGSATLVVRSGIYHALVAAPSAASLSPAASGTPSYVFSGNTAQCPPSGGGGAGAPSTTATSPKMCTGTVVANGLTGEIEDVEVVPDR